MGENTQIAWTDHTFNPWHGCQRVSPGCEHCYAETLAARFGTEWGPKVERRFFGDKHWNDPVRWNKKAEKLGVRQKVFCASMADVFEDRRDLDIHRERLWKLIEATPFLDWQLLTKRPQNIKAMLPESLPRRNVWLGTTIESQEYADQRIPHLIRNAAAVHFLSYEPGLGPVKIFDGCAPYPIQTPIGETLPPSTLWVIVGGESGNGARPFQVSWARDIVEQCRLVGVACFVKQYGGNPVQRGPVLSLTSSDKELAGVSDLWPIRLKDRKGGNMEEWEEGLRVREFPIPGTGMQAYGVVVVLPPITGRLIVPIAKECDHDYPRERGDEDAEG